MILITGATGIVGSHILADLLSEGTERLRCLVRPNANRQAIHQLCHARNLDESRVEFVIGDLLDPISIISAMNGCTEVYHCAAMVSFDPRKGREMMLVNVQGTANVVNACLLNDVKKLCYISSTAAIGDQLIDGILTEESVWTSDRNRSDYSLSKRYAELEVCRGREEGMSALIVNPGVVIGAGNWGESSTSLILSCEKGMRFYPSGSNGFVAATDIARFCAQGMKNQWFSGRFLLVGENLSFQSLFDKITSAFGSSRPKFEVPKQLIAIVRGGLQMIESLGLKVGSLTSENLSSALRKVRYSNERAREKGFEFTPIEEAVSETVMLYQTRI